jgi:ketosteroid isomerase-like protein
MGAYVLVFAFVTLTGPQNQKIDVNPNEVVTIRNNRTEAGSYFADGVRCLIHTTDGKIVNVVEDCDTVRARLRGE